MLSSKEILEKYLNFYKDRGHKQVPNVSLIPENDPTLLYVNSGMFPLVPYLSGQPHPMGTRLVNVQRALRFFEDLDNVGETIRHTTAFHMIGNWSFGDYFKKEQLPWVYEFLIEVLGLDPHKMYATVFAGDESAPKDTESIEIIKRIFAKYGIDAKENERIFARGKEDNWWKRGDAIGELGGPDSEIFYYVGSSDGAERSADYVGKDNDDNDGFGQDPTQNQTEFLEIGNSVFMQYKKTAIGWEELSQKNVDFGGGLERIALVVQGKQDIFETDNFWSLIEKIQELSGKNYGSAKAVTKAMRVLADHMRSSTFLAMDGVMPSNKDQGYILRRLLRRMVRAGRVLGVEKDISVRLVGTVCNMFDWLYPDLPTKQKQIEQIFMTEENKFRITLEKGMKEVGKNLIELGYINENRVRIKEKDLLVPQDVAKIAFDLYQSLGYPNEMFLEDLRDKHIEVDEYEFNDAYKNLSKAHQEESHMGAEQKFKGGLADQSENTIKYHTATHILQAVLREVLGSHVVQKGSNITGERLRFDFPNENKLTNEQITQIEKKFAEIISMNLPVNRIELPKDEAEKSAALHVFGEKYGDIVSVYYIGDSLEKAISKEFCGGPHVKNTGELLPIKIYKQENLGGGIIRIYARF